MRAPIASLLLVAACAGEPRLTAEIVDAGPRVLDGALPAGRDLTITVRYRDDDGDLGGGRALVHDCRSASLTSTFDLPAIASPEAVTEGVVIEGLLALTVRQVQPAAAEAMPPACTRLGVRPLLAGQTVFCVELEDTTHHRSSGSCTASVVVGE
jgi:hypothetical protein